MCSGAPFARILAILAIPAILATVSVSAQGPSGLPTLPVTSLEQLTERVQRPVTEPVVRPSTRLELDGARNISLTIARPSSIRSVLQLLVRGTPFSAVVHSSIRGTFAGELRNLTLRQALEAVLFPAGLDYDIRGTVIRIFARRPSTRLYPVDLVAVRRAWHSQPSISGGALVSSVESDAFTQVDSGVKSLLSSEGRHYVDRRAGVVHVTDFADRLDQIGVYLETVQLRATRQVRVDVQVLRLTVKSGVPIPTSWPAVIVNAQQFIRGLEATASVNTIASPRLSTMNNEPSTVSVSTGNEERSITVTPQVSADGFFQLHVTPRIVDRLQTDPARQTPPSFLEADALVRVREGETAIISGLSYSSSPQQPAEILILLTPSLVVPSLATQAGQR
jgi:type II secretory pathway component HofQ